MSSPSTEYGAKNIQVLSGLDPVRKRPGMYIGSTGKLGLHHLIWEILDNSVDEATNDYADKITLRLNGDGSVSVGDNGRGIPVEIHPTEGKPTVEVIFTTLHAGGKFDGGSYKYSGGLHGVGTSVVNALSSWVKVKVTRDGEVHQIGFHSAVEEIDGVETMQAGVVNEPLELIGKAPVSEHGTEVSFLPDPSVFSTVKWDLEMIQRRLRNSAYLNPGITFEMIYPDISGEDQTLIWNYPDGLQDYMNDVARTRLAPAEGEEAPDAGDDSAPGQYLESHLILGDTKNGVGEWEACLQWFPGNLYSMDSFANIVETTDGGAHVDGFNQAINNAMNKYARSFGMLGDRDPNLDAYDIRAGLAVVLSVKIQEPDFEGQTKGRLTNDSAKSMVRTQFYDRLTGWMDEHPAEISVVLRKIVDEMRTRKRIEESANQLRKASEKRGRAPKSQPLPTKLKDCQTEDRSEAELFLVEGDSAGGSADVARNPQTQALLPLRGKVLNINQDWPEESDSRYAYKMEKLQERMEKNLEIQSLINAIGAGSQDMFDLEEARYSKVIIMADADDDGFHIEALLIGIGFRMFRALIEDGRLYTAKSPLYRAVVKSEAVYAFNMAEREALEEIHGELSWTRFKGLGEMNADDLRDQVMDPTRRRLVRITMDDANEAEYQINAMLGKDPELKWQAVMESMGSQDELDSEFAL